MEWIKKHNVGAKIVALLGAILLWFFIMDGSTTIITRTIYADVEIINLDSLTAKDLVVLNNSEPRTEFSLNGPAKDINAIANSPGGYFRVTVDFSKISFTVPADYGVAVTIDQLIDIPSTVSFTSLPEKEKFYIDRIVEKSVPVELKLTGKLPEGYIISDKTLTPNMVTIKGPSSYLKSVTKAVAELKIDNVKSAFQNDIAMIFYDEGDNVVSVSDMPHTTIDPITVKAGISLTLDSTANIIVELITPDYLPKEAAQISIDPEIISISGDPSAVDLTNSITLEDINIKAFIENAEQFALGYVERPIILPNGITSEFNGKMARVYISFPGYVREEKTFTSDILPLLIDDIDADQHFEFEPFDFALTFFGPESAVASITEEHLVFEPLYNLEELEPGEQTVTFAVSCIIDGVAVLEGRVSALVNFLGLPDSPSDPQ